MSENTQFLQQRAITEIALAKAAPLENVRDNHLRAAAAWQKLAERSSRGDVLRAEDAERKAERAVLLVEAEANEMPDRLSLQKHLGT